MKKYKLVSIAQQGMAPGTRELTPEERIKWGLPPTDGDIPIVKKIPVKRKSGLPTISEYDQHVGAGRSFVIDWVKNRPQAQEGSIDYTAIPKIEHRNPGYFNDKSNFFTFGHYETGSNRIVLNKGTKAAMGYTNPELYSDMSSTAAHETTHAIQEQLKPKRKKGEAFPERDPSILERIQAAGSYLPDLVNTGSFKLASDLFDYNTQEGVYKEEKQWYKKHPDQIINPIADTYKLINNSPKLIKDSYLTAPEEIHARLMEWRKATGTKPTDRITPEVYQQRNQKLLRSGFLPHGIRQLYEVLKKEDIINLLDKTVLNDAVNYNPAVATAQQGMASPESVIVEQGEIGRDLQGNLIQIDPSAPSHNDPRLASSAGLHAVPGGKGGVLVDGLESVLSDSQSQINRGDRADNVKDAVIKIKAKEAQAIAAELGLPVKTSQALSPTKFFKLLQQSRDKQAKKFTIKDSQKGSSSKEFKTSQGINSIQQRNLPTDQDLYDLTFQLQESAKQQVPGYEEMKNQNLQQGGKAGSYRQFFPRQLAAKLDSVDQGLARQYPKDKAARTLVEKLKWNHFPADFDQELHDPTEAHNYPPFDNEYRQLQQKLLQVPAEQWVKTLHSANPVLNGNPLGIFKVNLPDQVSTMDLVKAGKKIHSDKKNYTFQAGGDIPVSIDGYKSDSPDRFNPANLIPSPSITMQDVDQPLMLYGDGGEVILAQPGEEYYLPNSQNVLEVPVGQQGGDFTTRRKALEAQAKKGNKAAKAELARIQKDEAEFNRMLAGDTGKKPGKFTLKGSSKKASGKPVPISAPQVVNQSALINSLLPGSDEPNPILSPAPASVTPAGIPVADLERAVERPVQVAPDGSIVQTDWQPDRSTVVAGKKLKVLNKDPFKFQPWQLAGDLYNLLDAQKRAPGFLQQLDENPVDLQELNPTAARADLYGAYQGAGQSIPDPHTQIGRGVQLQQYSNFLSALNNLNGQYAAQNTQISNQEALINNQMERQVAQTNLGLQDQAYTRMLGADEAARQQTSQAISSITGKIAQAQQQAANYKAFQSAFAPNMGLDEDGYITNDPDKIVTFLQGGIQAGNTNPNGKTQTKVVYNPDGSIKQSSKVQTTPNQVQYRQQGGKFKLKC